jgi:excisionase family DNA binding protein
MLTPREAAEILGVTVTTLACWARNGEVSSIPTLGGQRRFFREDVNDLLRRRAPEPERIAMETEVMHLYRQGWSIREVARQFECHYGTIRRILIRHAALRKGTETWPLPK